MQESNPEAAGGEARMLPLCYALSRWNHVWCGVCRGATSSTSGRTTKTTKATSARLHSDEDVAGQQVSAVLVGVVDGHPRRRLFLLGGGPVDDSGLLQRALPHLVELAAVLLLEEA